jgi:hypothetical protein
MFTIFPSIHLLPKNLSYDYLSGMSTHKAKSTPHYLIGFGTIFDYVGQTSLENDSTLLSNSLFGIKSDG